MKITVIMCVLLCFIDSILGNRYGPEVSSCQQTLDNHLGGRILTLCVLLCFVDPILGKLRSRCHSLNQGTWGGRIRTLHLNYVAGYTGPL